MSHNSLREYTFRIQAIKGVERNVSGSLQVKLNSDEKRYSLSTANITTEIY